MESLDRILSKINTFTTVDPLQKRNGRSELKVACIMDLFSYECFKYECTLEPLAASTWRQQLDNMEPDFILVESAWNGLTGDWKNQIIDLNECADAILLELIQYCKEHHLPTVFWNKEDDIFYPRFIHAAKLFDFIFTTDANCIELYKRDAGHDRVFVLPFAAQPAIHNPIDLYAHNKGNVAFSGSWYNRFTERNEQLKMLLNSAIEFGLTIFNRMNNKPECLYPDEYKAYIVGSLSYAQVVKSYKLYNVFLGVSTITNSPTMIARRYFELLACGTPIISSYAKAIESLFNGLVLISHTSEETTGHLEKLLGDSDYSRRLSVAGIREIYSKHLYKHRFTYIVENIGMPCYIDRTDDVCVITCLENMEQANNVLDNYSQQLWTKKQLILLVEDSIPLSLLEERINSFDNVSICSLSGMSISNRIHYIANNVSSHYISLFNPEHYYAPHFLTDLMHSFEYSHAQIVGKSARYELTDTGPHIYFPNQEHLFVNELCTSAMVVMKDVLRQIHWEGSSTEAETLFFTACTNRGYRIYATDRFNFLYVPVDIEQMTNQQVYQAQSYVTV